MGSRASHSFLVLSDYMSKTINYIKVELAHTEIHYDANLVQVTVLYKWAL